MTPHESARMQIQRYRQMSGQERLLIGLRLHELSCEVSRSAIRQRFPEATEAQVEEKLRQRLRLAYRPSAHNAVIE